MRTFEVHGYVPYTMGCRCDTCRAAKAAYMRERRANARRIAQENTSGKRGELGSYRYVADVKRHGTSYAYYERGCRCAPCTGFATALCAGLPSRRKP